MTTVSQADSEPTAGEMCRHWPVPDQTVTRRIVT
jgi:hypothetical protein